MGTIFVRLVFALAVVPVISAHFDAKSNQAVPKSEADQQSRTVTPRNNASQTTASLELPIKFERRVGDLDAMVKRHEIRALVVPSRSGFFYDKGHPKGIYYEAFAEFQHFVNKKLRTGSLKINVGFIPVRLEQLEQALLQGVGDVVAFGVIVTPEREKEVLFTTPIDSNVKHVIVTGPRRRQ